MHTSCSQSEPGIELFYMFWFKTARLSCSVFCFVFMDYFIFVYSGSHHLSTSLITLMRLTSSVMSRFTDCLDVCHLCLCLFLSDRRIDCCLFSIHLSPVNRQLVPVFIYLSQREAGIDP